uniref:SH3 domain-binding protein 5-like n=1 Tax=Steinernema glaseri TaxID=37863 RepID=A0A1I7Y3C7_9BILA
MSAAYDVAPCQSSNVASTSNSLKETKPESERQWSSSEDGIHYVDDDDGVEFSLDARHLNRVHEELEKLNIATDVINKLELQLDESRAHFRNIQSSWSQRLKELTKKYGSAIEKGRPYYEAKLLERKIREDAQKAAIRFEKATSMLAVAKQQVNLSEESLNRDKTPTTDCLEVLNYHIQKVKEADEEVCRAEVEHRDVSAKMMEIRHRIAQMEKDNGKAIKKSRHYFEQRIEFTRVLEHQKALIQRLEAEVKQKKCDYTTSLRNLEQISESIHEERSLSSVKRGSGGTSPDYAVQRQDSIMDYQMSNENLTTESKTSDLHIEESEDSIDPAMFDEDPEDSSLSRDRRKRPSSLGNGVILLAQQLIGHHDAEADFDRAFYYPPEQADVSYRTLPEGIRPLPETPSESDLSSLASGRSGYLNGMLRSHSQLINEIDGSIQRVGDMLHRSVSDVEELS